LVDTEGNGTDGERGLSEVERGGAAHSNTQKKRDKSRDNFLDCRESTEGERGESGTGETEDVTWGPRDSQVLLKIRKIKGIAHKGTGV